VIQEEASKFSSISKFCINVFQLERINLSDVLLVKTKVSVIIYMTCYFE